MHPSTVRAKPSPPVIQTASMVVEPSSLASGQVKFESSAPDPSVRQSSELQGSTISLDACVMEEPQMKAPQRSETHTSLESSPSQKTSTTRGKSSELLPTVVFEKRHSEKSDKNGAKTETLKRKKSSFLSSAVRWENSKVAKGLSVTALLIALFGGGIFILFDVPDDPGTTVQDTIMIIVLVYFALELVWKFLIDPRTYRWSFFFWMDLLGTISMVFEISFLLGSAGKMDEGDRAVNTVMLRTARAAKVGARAGRLTKVVKVISLLYWEKLDERDGKDAKDEAKVLSAKLMTTLSTKVSMLTVVLIMGVPLLDIGRYPEDDLSLKAWCDRLEADYFQAYRDLDRDTNLQTTPIFEETVAELSSFYSDLWYFPYRIEGFNQAVSIHGTTLPEAIPGQSLIQDETPQRKSNIVKRSVSRCRVSRAGVCADDDYASIYFDFAKVKKYEAGMDFVLIFFIVCCMAAESADLSATLDRMVVKPMERMLGTVRMMAKVLSLVTEVGSRDDDDDEETDPDMERSGRDSKTSIAKEIRDEAELLENVFHKLAKLTAVFMQDSIADEVEMAELDVESKGVIIEVMGMNSVDPQRVASVFKKDRRGLAPVVSENPFTIEDMLSWNLDILNLAPEHREKVVTSAFFDSEVGKQTGGLWVDVGVFRAYFAAVKAGYYENPYHNFVHAVDVFVVVWRMLTRLQCTKWVSDVDLCALQLATLSHDIGHRGKTNPFLVETMHELAIRYNDKSPLENMHCSKMFDICTNASSNVFKKFNKEAYKQARKVCIDTILHTDNSLHFDMVKDVKKMYEVSSAICDGQAFLDGTSKTPDEANFADDYIAEVLAKDVVLWLKLILHMSDISTPLKPWEISKAWAYRVQDEFFSQGDEEKRLGIPVGMLNDRDKVNRQGAEHGFIVFLVSPLVTSAVGVFPALQNIAEQMATNLESWRNLWVEAASPSQEEVAKRDIDVKKVKDQVTQLEDRSKG